MTQLKTTGWRNRLLQTSAITTVGLAVALSFSGRALAADQEVLAGTGNTITPGAANTIVNAANANTDTGDFDINGDVIWGSNTVKSVNFSTLGGHVYIYDSALASTDAATFNGDVSIVNGETLSFHLGNTAALYSGGALQATNGGVSLHFSDGANSDIFLAGANASTRGGNLAIIGENNVDRNLDGSRTHTVTVDGNVLLGTVSLTAGNAGAADGSGDSITATFGNASSDTFNVTGLTLTGGAALNNLTANRGIGGAVSTTINGQATIGATGLTVQGGAAGASTAAGNVGGAASLTFNAATTLSGAVTVTGGDKDGNDGGDASVTFANNVTSTTTLALTTGGAGGGGAGTAGDATATFGGDVTFGGTGITMTQTAAAGGTTGTPGVIFNGTAAQNVTGAITGGGALTVSNTGGKVTFNSAIGAASLNSVTTNADSDVKFNSTVDATAMTLNGSTEFDDAVTVGTGDLTIANGAVLQVGNQITNGETLFTTTNGGSNFSVGAATLRMPSNFVTGTISLVDDTATDISGDTGQFSVVDTALTNFTVQSNGGDNTIIEVTATQKSASQTANELGVTNTAGAAMGAAVNGNLSNNTIIDAYTTALYGGTGEASKAAEQSVADPTAGGSISQVAQSTAQAGFDIIATRLGSVRPGGQLAKATGTATGVASGDVSSNGATWIKAYSTLADQEKRDGIYGYNAWTAGLMGGADANITDNARIGLAVGYSYSNVDGDGSSDLSQNLYSYQGSLYGDYTGEGWYVEAMAGYAYNDVSTERAINFGGLNRTAKGDYQSNQYTGGLTVGFPVALAENHTLTPMGGLTYTFLEGGEYTETGAGELNQTVRIDDNHALLGKVGMKYNAFIPAGSGNIVPELRALALYDFIGDEAKSTNTFAGNTSYIANGADVARLGGVFGAGLAYVGENGMWSIGMDYDAEMRESFLAHNGQIEARFKF